MSVALRASLLGGGSKIKSLRQRATHNHAHDLVEVGLGDIESILLFGILAEREAVRLKPLPPGLEQRLSDCIGWEAQ